MFYIYKILLMNTILHKVRVIMDEESLWPRYGMRSPRCAGDNDTPCHVWSETIVRHELN